MGYNHNEILLYSLRIGRKIKVFRSVLDITQSDLARDIGSTQQKICSWETGKTLIPMRRLLQISLVYGVSLSNFDIYNEEDFRKTTSNPQGGEKES